MLSVSCSVLSVFSDKGRVERNERETWLVSFSRSPLLYYQIEPSSRIKRSFSRPLSLKTRNLPSLHPTNSLHNTRKFLSVQRPTVILWGSANLVLTFIKMDLINKEREDVINNAVDMVCNCIFLWWTFQFEISLNLVPVSLFCRSLFCKGFGYR